jgi:hypothetical protein
MPWFPDVVAAVELARSQTRAVGQADPVAQYLTALSERDPGLPAPAPGYRPAPGPRCGERNRAR